MLPSFAAHCISTCLLHLPSACCVLRVRVACSGACFMLDRQTDRGLGRQAT